MLNEGAPSQEFVVSHTSFEGIVSTCHLRETLDTLPTDAIVLEVGSGLNQEFATGLGKLRPDVHVISLDPTLAISPEDKSWFVSQTGSFHTFNKQSGEPVNELQAQRLENIAGDLAIAADGRNLPFASDSVDLIVDNLGPALYLNGTELASYLESVYRVLKPGGSAHISEINMITDATVDPVTWRDQSQRELNELFDEVLPAAKVTVFNNETSSGIILRKD